MNRNKCKGLQYESQARDYLLQRDLTLLEQNYHSRFGEIDLIMLHRDVVCFIEVKFRNSMVYGGAASAISTQKQKKIVKTALVFIAKNSRYKQHSMRFDALLMQQQAGNQSPGIDWIQNAFLAE